MSTAAQPAKLLLPETSSPITLSFTHDKEFPDQYRSIIIHSPGQTTTITAHHPILRIPATRKERKDAFLWNADIPGLKIDRSRYFLVGQYSAENKPHTLIFFLSAGYASDAAPLLVVAFSEEGTPVKLFEREYEMTSFEQTQDGALLTGKASLSQGLCSSDNPKGPSAATYDPFSVYLIQPGSKPIYQLEAARAYNLKHYAWIGPQSSERYVVIENLPGHPKFFAIPGPQASKLLAKVKCN